MRISEGPSGLGPAGSTGCSLNKGNYETTAGIYYEEADTSVSPNTTSSIDPSRYLFPDACGNPGLNMTTPAYAMNISEPEVTINLLMTGQPNATGEFVWYMNNVTFLGDYNDPVFLDALTGTTNFSKERQVYDLGSAKSVRLVMTSVGFPASHPMHIHGHNAYVLAEGTGSWGGEIINPSNPQRRDTQLIRPNGYLVMQIDLDNPGMVSYSSTRLLLKDTLLTRSIVAFPLPRGLARIGGHEHQHPGTDSHRTEGYVGTRDHRTDMSRLVELDEWAHRSADRLGAVDGVASSSHDGYVVMPHGFFVF